MHSVSCPYCRGAAYAEYVDIGVGYQQVTPYQCEVCDAQEVSASNSKEDLSQVEIYTGWYQGHTEISGVLREEFERYKATMDEKQRCKETVFSSSPLEYWLEGRE